MRMMMKIRIAIIAGADQGNVDMALEKLGASGWTVVSDSSGESDSDPTILGTKLFSNCVIEMAFGNREVKMVTTASNSNHFEIPEIFNELILKSKEVFVEMLGIKGTISLEVTSVSVDSDLLNKDPMKKLMFAIFNKKGEASMSCDVIAENVEDIVQIVNDNLAPVSEFLN